MASKLNKSQTTFMYLTLFLSILLSLIPWPELISISQPYWLALTIAYWSLINSDSRMMFIAFAFGLLIDVMYGSLLGKHGFSLVAVSFLMTKFSKRLRMTSMLQLLAMILALLLNDLIIRSIIDWISFKYLIQWKDFIPVITAALIWPWLKYLMDRINISLRNN